MFEAVEYLAVQVGGYVFADFAVAGGLVDVVCRAGGFGVDLELEGDDDGLEFTGAVPGIGANDRGEVQIAEVDGVEFAGGADE